MKTEDKILDYLLRGNSLTTLECQKLFHTSELRHYISRISKRGYATTGKWIKIQTGSIFGYGGNEVKVKRYSIANNF
ncbi:MAG: helix-turn-helix domain-containing protein [Candidatus Micrarchaeia archaeon]|jgi:hypothetical protein